MSVITFFTFLFAFFELNKEGVANDVSVVGVDIL